MEREKRQLQTIKAAYLDLSQGRVDRVEVLLVVSLTQAKNYMSMSLHVDDPGMRGLQQTLIQSHAEVGLLKQLNSPQAKQFEKWFSTTGARAAGY